MTSGWIVIYRELPRGSWRANPKVYADKEKALAHATWRRVNGCEACTTFVEWR